MSQFDVGAIPYKPAEQGWLANELIGAIDALNAVTLKSFQYKGFDYEVCRATALKTYGAAPCVYMAAVVCAQGPRPKVAWKEFKMPIGTKELSMWDIVKEDRDKVSNPLQMISSGSGLEPGQVTAARMATVFAPEVFVAIYKTYGITTTAIRTIGCSLPGHLQNSAFMSLPWGPKGFAALLHHAHKQSVKLYRGSKRLDIKSLSEEEILQRGMQVWYIQVGSTGYSVSPKVVQAEITAAMQAIETGLVIDNWIETDLVKSVEGTDKVRGQWTHEWKVKMIEAMPEVIFQTQH